MLKRLLFAGLCLLSLTGAGDVLLWQIDDSSYVDGTPMDIFISPLPDDDENWAVGRVKITTGAGVVKYLDIASPKQDMNLPPDIYNGAEGVYIGGGGEFYGSPWTQGILPSDVDATALFAIEIGMNHWIDDGTDEGRINFELLAFTDPHTYEQLQDFMYPQHDLNPLTATPWNPTYYHTTPEPQSGMLLTVGLAVLMLRRRRFSAFQAADSGQALSGPIVNVPVP